MAFNIEIFKRDNGDSLQDFKSRVEELYSSCVHFDVCSMWAAGEAQDIVAACRKEKRRIENARREIIDPYKASINQINHFFSTFTDKLEESASYLEEKISEWKEKAKRNQEAEAILYETATFNKDSDVTVHRKDETSTIRSQQAISYERTEWQFDVEDLSIVPIEFLRIDEDKVKKLIRMGLRNIPGVRIFEEKKTIIRSL